MTKKKYLSAKEQRGQGTVWKILGEELITEEKRNLNNKEVA